MMDFPGLLIIMVQTCCSVQCGGQAEFVAEERTAPYPGLREDDTQRDQYAGLRWKEILYAL